MQKDQQIKCKMIESVKEKLEEGWKSTLLKMICAVIMGVICIIKIMHLSYYYMYMPMQFSIHIANRIFLRF